MPANPLKSTSVNFGGGGGAGNVGPGFPPATLGTGAYGGIPIVPNPTQTATQAIQGNIGNLSSLYGLGTGLSGITAAEAQGQYQANLPGYSALISKASANIGEDLAGQLPADVISLLQQQAAERGVATGSPDSPNSNAAYLRTLGLTSLGRKDLGQQELTSAIGRTPTGPLFNPASMLVTPEQQQAAAAAQQLYNAAPNPTLAAQEAQRLAQLGLGSGAGAVGAAPGLRSPIGAGGPAFTSGASGGKYPTRSPGLDMSPQDLASWAGFESNYWDDLGPESGGWNLGGTSPGVSDFGQTIFGAPQLSDASTLGAGLDPTLNALFGTAPGAGNTGDWWNAPDPMAALMGNQSYTDQPAPGNDYYGD